MRVFVAVDITDDTVRNGIAGAQRRMRGRAVAGDNLHFTLRFLGEMDSGVVRDVAGALERVRFGEFSVTLRGIGAFGGSRFPRVVWVGTDSEGGNALNDLAGMVDRALGDGSRGRPFRPHLTILRAGRRDELGAYRDRVWGVQRVSSIKLKQSVPGGGGRVYRDVAVVTAWT